MNLAGLPKIELHLHLDCSLSYAVVQQFDPSVTVEEYQQSFVAPAKCLHLADYISRALRGIALMQTEAQLRLVTLDLLQQLKADGVLYAEIRFAPLEHLQQGLTPAQVVAAVQAAMVEGSKDTGVEARLILCTLRHYSEAQSLETVKLAAAFRGPTVVGFDIAADEAGFPINNHVSAFAYAREMGLPCTAHAGEARGPESVWETVRQLHPRRIGHGVRSSEDERLLAFLKANDVHLELCCTSNIQTNIYESLRQHPVDQLYQTGVSLGINTDTRTISQVTLTSEYQVLADLFGWTKAHFLHCNLEALRHAFADEATKDRLRQQLLAAYADAPA